MSGVAEPEPRGPADRPRRPRRPRPPARRHAAAPLALLAGGALLAAEPAGAQRVVATVDVGHTQLRAADQADAALASATPSLRLDWPRATIGLSGTVSHLAAGGWSGQGALAGSVFTPPAGPLVGELSALAGVGAVQGGARARRGLGVARAHLMGARAGLWVGAGAGRADDDAGGRRVRLGEAGAWARHGAAMALVSVGPTAVDDTIRYADAQAAFRLDVARLELGASAGLRTGRQPTGAPVPALLDVGRSWGSASLAAWLTSHVALVGTAGTYPADPTQGLPGGRFASVGLRLGTRERRAAPETGRTRGRLPVDAVATAGVAAGATGFEARADGDGRWTLRVRADGARTLELAGDFTGWEPVALAATGDGWWSVTLAVAAGAHEMNVRRDGGAWIVPPGLAVVTDEFGGTSGVLVIEDPRANGRASDATARPRSHAGTGPLEPGGTADGPAPRAPGDQAAPVPSRPTADLQPRRG